MCMLHVTCCRGPRGIDPIQCSSAQGLAHTSTRKTHTHTSRADARSRLLPDSVGARERSNIACGKRLQNRSRSPAGLISSHRDLTSCSPSRRNTNFITNFAREGAPERGERGRVTTRARVRHCVLSSPRDSPCPVSSCESRIQENRTPASQ